MSSPDGECLIVPYVFAVKPDSERAPRAGVSRDGGALLNLCWILGREGYELGSPWLNYPDFPYPTAPPTTYQRADLDYSHTGPGDLFVQGTRFPLHDDLDDTRKKVPSGGTTLELQFSRFWTQFYSYFTRGSMKLAPDIQPSLRPGFEAYRSIGFQLNNGSNVVQLAHGRPERTGSVAFLLRTDAMWEGGPGLFAAFAMDADSTFAWSLILRQRMRWLTQRRGFFMVALESPAERRFRGDYGDIASEWTADLVLEHDFVNEPAA